MRRVRGLLLALQVVALVAYLIGLLRHGPGFEPVVDVWLSATVQFLPCLIAWSALPGAKGGGGWADRRAEVTCLALGLTGFGVGNILFVVDLARGVESFFPSHADLLLLSFFPLTLIALGLAARRELRGAGGAVWLDGALGALGAAAVLAALLDQIFSATTDTRFAIGIALVYPLCDLAMISTAVGIAAQQGRAVQRYWLPLVAGFSVFAFVDVRSAIGLASNTWAPGAPTDALWGVAATLIALWALARPGAEPDRDQGGPLALIMPAVAGTAGLAVLVAAAVSTVSPVAVVLAAATQLASSGRTQLAFHGLRRLADLRRLAGTDDLTGLPNRRAFHEQGNARLAAPPGNGGDGGQGRSSALLLLDLDRFKEINDSLGHHAGDQLLVEVSRRLREQLRDEDRLARLGGDEFAILLHDVDRDEAVKVAQKLRAALGGSFPLEGIAIRTDASIGIALAPEHGRDVSVLLRRADIAMYGAKQARDGQQVWAGLEGDTTARLVMLDELPAAIAAGQMVLHYQPKLDLAADRVTGAEALVRWDHPERGLIYPDAFLPLVEDAGLMRELTRSVLEQALDQLCVWRAQGRGLAVAVNLSASSLVDVDLPGQVEALLTWRDLPASVLQLEITEEFLMADRDRARGTLERLRTLGIRIAIDDFGTGYSSLAYLRELPVDELKLDRSFVFPMADDARAAALVFSTIELAHSLGLRLVAEGVENRAALDELARHGCDEAQGYYMSRPLPPAALELWLDERAQLARAGDSGHSDSSSA